MGFENGHLARVVFEANNGPAEVINTLHYDLVGNTLDDAASLQDLADRLADDLLALWKALFDPAWTIEPVLVTDELDPLNPSAPRSGASGGSAGPGTGSDFGSSTRLPNPLCALASIRTGLLGRSFRGRMFLPPVWNESNTVDGQVGGARLVTYRAFTNAIPKEPDIIVGPSTATAEWVVYSPTRRALDLDPYATPVDSITVGTKLHWLRSRDD